MRNCLAENYDCLAKNNNQLAGTHNSLTKQKAQPTAEQLNLINPG